MAASEGQMTRSTPRGTGPLSPRGAGRAAPARTAKKILGPVLRASLRATRWGTPRAAGTVPWGTPRAEREHAAAYPRYPGASRTRPLPARARTGGGVGPAQRAMR